MYAEDMEDKEDLPPHQYTETEMKDMETLFMGTESKVRKRFNMKGQRVTCRQ